MSKTTLTYSHCRPIQYHCYDQNGHAPALMIEAYNITNQNAYDLHNSYEEYNPGEYLTLIGVEFGDETYGVLHCLTTNNSHNTGIRCHPHDDDTLRVFPDKKTAMMYMTKYIETMRKYS